MLADVLKAERHAVPLPDVEAEGDVVLPAVSVREAAGGGHQLTVRARVEQLVVSPHLPGLTDLRERGCQRLSEVIRG